MRKLPWLALFLALQFGLPVAALAQVFNPQTATLANGLKIIVVENHAAPVVSQMVWYGVGSADEPQGQSGIAHYLEHLMFKGDASAGETDFSRIIGSLGGQDNAFTSQDYTAYFQQIAVSELPRIMAMEAKRMRSLQFDAERAKRELAVVLAERTERTDDNPEGRFMEAMWATLFVHHPYGRPVIGWAHEIEKLDATAAQQFYAAWYAPARATVVISGATTLEEVLRLAAGTYGTLANPPGLAVPPQPRVRLAEPALTASRRVVLHDEKIRQPEWQRLWRLPSMRQLGPVNDAAWQVLAEYLNGPAGPLQQQLVREQQLAVGVSATYQNMLRDASVFGVGAVPRAGVSLAALETATAELLGRVATQGISEGDMQAARQRLVRAAQFARDSLLAPGYAFGMALATDRTVADVEEWPQRIAAVTVLDVNHALKALVARQDYVSGELLPADPARAAAAPATTASPRTLSTTGGMQ